MKNQLFALIGLGLLLATASAYAQTGVVKANVPFNFIVNKAELPAGQYTIQSVGSSASAMSIQSLDNQIVKLVLPHACESPKTQETSKLVFHRYGSQYFLARSGRQGTTGDRSCPRAAASPKSRWTIRSRMLS